MPRTSIRRHTRLDRMRARLFPAIGDGERTRPAIDWPAIEIELKRRGVTLLLSWQECLELGVHSTCIAQPGRDTIDRYQDAATGCIVG